VIHKRAKPLRGGGKENLILQEVKLKAQLSIREALYTREPVLKRESPEGSTR
jgi:hypothetical protein